MNRRDPNGKIYGMTRASTPGQKESPEVQRCDILNQCSREGWPEPEMLDEPLGTSGTIPFRRRPMGSWALRNLKSGDMLIVTDVDRLGRNAVDIMDTADRMDKKGVQLIILQFHGMDLDYSTDTGKLILMIFAWGAEHEHRRIRDRTVRAKEQKRAAGLYCQRSSFGIKKVPDEIGHGSHWVWDEKQLRIIHEMAERAGNGESIESINADFSRRKIVDHRGKPWTGFTKNPWHTYRKAIRWYHRMKHEGKLPQPFANLALLVKESPRFSVEPRPRKRMAKVKENPIDSMSADELRALISVECPDLVENIS